MQTKQIILNYTHTQDRKLILDKISKRLTYNKPFYHQPFVYVKWRGVVGNAFRLKRSYSTPGPVSTAMGDCLQAGKPSRCEACQLSRLSLLPSVGWQNE